MATKNIRQPLIAIVGETASGKTAVAIEIAKKVNGEIICADSRTVYKKLDIGTAKPSAQEQAGVKHHLLDVVEPDESFTVADFKRLADESIADISKRGKVPLLVGGSGLYIDAVLYDYQFSSSEADRSLQNPRHLKPGSSKDRSNIIENTCVLGLAVPRELLKQRISLRIDRMIQDGFIEEVKMLDSRYPGCKPLESTSYRAFRRYIKGEVTLKEARAQFVKNDLSLAKRQRTWFRRNKEIKWYDNQQKLVDQAESFVNNNRTEH